MRKILVAKKTAPPAARSLKFNNGFKLDED
jgi:hypothetical protein